MTAVMKVPLLVSVCLSKRGSRIASIRPSNSDRRAMARPRGGSRAVVARHPIGADHFQKLTGIERRSGSIAEDVVVARVLALDSHAMRGSHTRGSNQNTATEICASSWVRASKRFTCAIS